MNIDSTALFTLSYGLFILTANENGKDGGCVVNTVMQVTDRPKRISVCVNKQNNTCGMIERTGRFNASVLTQSAPFALFERFGFQSGRDVDKFAGSSEPRTENGIRYMAEHANAVLSGQVVQTIDLGSHMLFIADLQEAKKLSGEPSITYAYYFANTKPKPEPKPKRGFVCKICGYFYEGDELPPDYVCPICKHGAEDFEPVGF